MSVRFAGVSFRYPGADADALAGVDLECPPGSVTLLTGPLGSGCSTLLLAAAGLAPHATGGARAGVVTTLGSDPATDEGRTRLAGRIGLLLPTPATQLSGMAFSVWDEVAFGPANLGWSRERIGQEVERALALFEVSALARRDPRTLSGGELQRVMLAAVAAMTPSVWLLDEPAAELDPEGADRLYRLLPRLAADATVLLATTDLDRSVSVADRAVLLDRGRIVASGSAADALANDRALALGCSTTPAEVSCAAGAAAPHPLTVDQAVARFGS